MRQEGSEGAGRGLVRLRGDERNDGELGRRRRGLWEGRKGAIVGWCRERTDRAEGKSHPHPERRLAAVGAGEGAVGLRMPGGGGERPPTPRGGGGRGRGGGGGRGAALAWGLERQVQTEGPAGPPTPHPFQQPAAPASLRWLLSGDAPGDRKVFIPCISLSPL